jgi:MFS family permease
MSWVMSWEKNITITVTSVVSSLFQSNNISGILGTVLSILQTALQPMYSKISDITGRATAYTFAVFMFIASFIIMACSTNYNMLIVRKKNSLNVYRLMINIPTFFQRVGKSFILLDTQVYTF